MLLELDEGYPDWSALGEITEQLRAGAVVTLPTDTRYALAACLEQARGIQRMASIKEAARTKRFSILCADLEQAGSYVEGMSSYAYRSLRSLLPGPYTFVLPAGKTIPRYLYSKQRTVGVRVPEHQLCQALVERLGCPLACTSLPWDLEEHPVQNGPSVQERWGERVDLVVGQGSILAQESTVVDLTVHPPVVLREGAGDLSWFGL